MTTAIEYEGTADAPAAMRAIKGKAKALCNWRERLATLRDMRSTLDGNKLSESNRRCNCDYVTVSMKITDSSGAYVGQPSVRLEWSVANAEKKLLISMLIDVGIKECNEEISKLESLLRERHHIDPGSID